MKEDSLLMIFVTVPNEEVAARLGKTLVTEKLIACVNIISGIRSIYSWQGKLEDSSEALMIIKTTQACYPNVEKRLQELHPYDTPEIIAVSPKKVANTYSQWVMNSCISS